MEVTREGLESADDVALADKMNAGRKAIIAELQKQIVGQAEVIELVVSKRAGDGRWPLEARHPGVMPVEID